MTLIKLPITSSGGDCLRPDAGNWRTPVSSRKYIPGYGGLHLAARTLVRRNSRLGNEMGAGDGFSGRAEVPKAGNWRRVIPLVQLEEADRRLASSGRVGGARIAK
jgi:hypothetical protein